MKLATALVVAGLVLAAAPADRPGRFLRDLDARSRRQQRSDEGHLRAAEGAVARATPACTGGFGGFGGSRQAFGGRPTPPRPSSGGRNDGTGGQHDADRRREGHACARWPTYVKGLASIVIEHTDHSTFTVTDAQGRSRLFPTDGTKTPQALATTTVDSVTKWDGPHMVTVYTIGPAASWSSPTSSCRRPNRWRCASSWTTRAARARTCPSCGSSTNSSRLRIELQFPTLIDGQHSPASPRRPEGRHRVFRRPRHERGASLDARQGRDPVRLHREPRPARRSRLRRDPAQGAAVRRREGAPRRLPRADGRRRASPRCRAARSTSPPPACPTSTPRRSAAPSPARCSSSP